MSLRSKIEKLSRNKVFRRRISVKGASVPIYVSPDAQLKYLKPAHQWDQDLIELAEAHVSDTSMVWDVGANIGVFSLAAASIAKNGHVYALEPDTFLCEIIERSRQTSNFSNLSIIPAAMSGTLGLSEFAIAERGRASNALVEAGGRSQMGGTRQTRLVPTISGQALMEAMPAPPDIVKIDVEGAELFVLEGMRSVLETSLPIIYIEVGAESKDAVHDLLSGYGYTLDPKTPNIGNRLYHPAAK